MVGLTPYMRCVECKTVMTLGGVQSRQGCVCGHRGFRNVNPTVIERLVCWLLKR